MAVPQFDEMLEAREVPTKKSKINKKNEKKLLLVAQELKIARALAGNDKTLRHRALKSLKKWFHHRSQNIPFTEEDFLRLWKGLFYSMWMSDKPLTQEECAEGIASLLHELPLVHSLVLFKCGLITLTNEWFGIDQLRLDKFMMFVRRLLRQALFVLRNNGYKKNAIETFGEILTATVLNHEKKDAMGLLMHFTEIFLEELAKVTEGNIRPDLVTLFLVPFTKCLAISDDPRKIKHIRKFIFVHLMTQSDAGLEYQEKYNAWKREGFPGSINAMQKVAINEDNGDNSDNSEESEAESSSKDRPLDPRAGRVDVELPQIKFHPRAIADLLIKNKYTDGSTVATRKAMTLLANQFRKLTSGTYPLGVTNIKLPKSDLKDIKLKNAVNRLVKFEQKLLGQDVRSKKRKLKEEKHNGKVKRQKVESGVKDNVDLDDFEQKVKNFTAISEADVKMQKKKKKVMLKEAEKRKMKKRKGVDIETNIFSIETPLRKKVKKSVELEPEPENFFERNSGLWLVYNQDESDCSLLDSSSADLGNFLENEIENVHDSSTDENKKKVSDSPKKVPNNSPKKFDISSETPIIEKNVSEESPNKKKKRDSLVTPQKNESILRGKSVKNKKVLNNSKGVSVLNGVSSSPIKETANTSFNTPTKELFPKNPWDEPLEEGEYEICIPAKSYVEKLKTISRKSTQNVQELINNSLAKSRLSLDFANSKFSTPQSAKRVKINTKLNQSQEFEDYHSQILSSPAITFDGSKKPGKPLLKTPNVNSPVNPFYKQLDF